MTQNPDDDLDLPALDGETDEEPSVDAGADLIETDEEDGNPFDDATAGDAVDHGVTLEGGPERGLLVDAEDAATLDVGAFDLAIGAEDGDLLDDSAEGRGSDEDLDTSDESVVADAGEEGPTDDDEELKEEDLPALDADEDGDVADDELYDRAMLSDQDELRWDDRAWSRLEVAAVGFADDAAADESGTLASPGEDPANRVRDEMWKKLEETGRVTAATLLPGGGVVLAIATTDWGRALMVRIVQDGTARIIAEIDPREDDGEACRVTHLRWEPVANRLVATGTFGVAAFRPS